MDMELGEQGSEPSFAELQPVTVDAATPETRSQRPKRAAAIAAAAASARSSKEPDLPNDEGDEFTPKAAKRKSTRKSKSQSQTPVDGGDELDQEPASTAPTDEPSEQSISSMFPDIDDQLKVPATLAEELRRQHDIKLPDLKTRDSDPAIIMRMKAAAAEEARKKVVVQQQQARPWGRTHQLAKAMRSLKMEEAALQSMLTKLHDRRRQLLVEEERLRAIEAGNTLATMAAGEPQPPMASTSSSSFSGTSFM